MACNKAYCSCCQTAYLEGVTVGVRIGYDLGYQRGYKKGYVDGYVDASLGLPAPSTYRPLIEARLNYLPTPIELKKDCGCRLGICRHDTESFMAKLNPRPVTLRLKCSCLPGYCICNSY